MNPTVANVVRLLVSIDSRYLSLTPGRLPGIGLIGFFAKACAT
jgi:hypothetical protein